MPLLALDEEILKMIATKVYSVMFHDAINSSHPHMRLVMPSLCLRQTNQTLHRLIPPEQVREKIHKDLAWFRGIFINTSVMSVLDAVTGNMPHGFVQMQTLEKDGIFFHVQLHTEGPGLLLHSHEMIARHNGKTTRSGTIGTVCIPGACMVKRNKRTAEQQEELVEWCREHKTGMLTMWATVFAGLHKDMSAKSMKMFADMA